MSQKKTVPVSAIAVIGSGSWGKALSMLLARNGNTVRLWGIEVEIKSLMQNRRGIYLSEIELPENISLFLDLKEALYEVRDVLIAVPSFAFRETLKLIKPYLASNARLFWGTKGIDSSDKLLHEVVKEELGDIPVAVLSGPTFALEVARGLPTAITVAVTDHNFAQDLSRYLHGGNFRVYISDDLIGVQICGAVKNVLAIAVGMSDGLGFGSNARCALITRGLAEMMRLGKALGGKTETFMGLAGLGDLVLTCTDDKSRNRRFGLAVGRGVKREQAEREIKQVVEGISNAKSVYLLAQSFKIDMPITQQVYRILCENLSLQDAVSALFQRSQKSEN